MTRKLIDFFTTVGSPHSWPSVLAMLAWLVEIVNEFLGYKAEDVVFDKDFEDDFNLEEKKFTSFVRTYKDESEENIQKELMVSIIGYL